MQTKKVKLLNLYASPRGTFPARSVIDLPEKEADQLVKEGYAVHSAEQSLVVAPKKSSVKGEKSPAPETATGKQAEETATEKKHEDGKAV